MCCIQYNVEIHIWGWKIKMHDWWLSVIPRTKVEAWWQMSVNKLGNVFNRDGYNASHVTNRLTKYRQSSYGFGNADVLKPGATPGVQTYLCLCKCICQPTLTYGLGCMITPAIRICWLESVQGRLIKQNVST